MGGTAPPPVGVPPEETELERQAALRELSLGLVDDVNQEGMLDFKGPSRVPRDYNEPHVARAREQVAGEQAQRERYDAMEIIGAGLRQAYVPTVFSAPPQRPPDTLFQLLAQRRQQEQQQQGRMVSPQMESYLQERFGGRVPTGLSTGEMHGALQAELAEESGHRAFMRMGQSEESLELRKIKEARLAEQFRQNQAVKLDRLGQSEARLSRLTGVNERQKGGYLKSLRALRNIRERYSPELVGPLQGRFNEILRVIGVPPADFAALQADLRRGLADWLSATTGAQRSQKEIDFLSVAIPAVQNGEMQFIELLDQWQEIVIEDSLDFAKGLDIQHWQPHAEQVREKVRETQRATERIVELKSPTGQVIPSDKLERYRKERGEDKYRELLESLKAGGYK